MEKVPEDLLVEILSRLPDVKSLIRFKCVSKQWYSLISNPSFAKLHLNQVTKTSYYYASCEKIIKSSRTQCIDYVAFDRDDGKEAIRLISLPSCDAKEDWGKLIGSCNGLICLGQGRYFILRNPCIGRSKKLPNCFGSIPNEGYGFFTRFWGFGYDHIFDDYKILIGAESFDASMGIIAVVFSLKSNSWRRISNEHAEKAYFGGVYFNGALHWCARQMDIDGLGLDSILSLDLADEKFKNIIPTPKADNGSFSADLGVHEGQLFIYNVTWLLGLEAWIWKENGNGNSWIKWFDVWAAGMPWYRVYIRLITRTKSGKMVFMVDEQLMVLFNPEDQTNENILVISDCGYEKVTTYIESLVFPFD